MKTEKNEFHEMQFVAIFVKLSSVSFRTISVTLVKLSNLIKFASKKKLPINVATFSVFDLSVMST